MQSLGWTVPEQSGGSVFQPKHAVLHRTETQCLRDLSLEKGALKVVCCNKKTKMWMGKKRMESFFDSEKDIYRLKRTKKRYEWVICMYGAWCFGDVSRTADTLVLYETVWGKHECTVNVWDWTAGPWGRKITRSDGLLDVWMDGAGLVPILLWNEWFEGRFGFP